MTVILLAAGIGIVLFAVYDIFRTTLTTRGAGPLTWWLAQNVWRGLLAMHRRRPHHRTLANAGPLIMALVVVLWVLLLWSGWSLIFNAAETSVIHSHTGEPAGIWARIYFAGFNLFTLGLGDYSPNGASWQIATALAAANGLLTITLAITYLVPIVSAAAEKRRLATMIAGLGMTPSQILRNAWDGESFGALDQHLLSLGPMIALQGQQHLAYPMLRHFHSENPQTALAPRLAALDEALHLMRSVVAPEARLHHTITGPTASAIDVFLSLLGMPPAGEAPSADHVAGLRSSDIPLEATADLAALARAREKRRRLLLSLVEGDGWSWEEVVGSDVQGEGRFAA